MLLLLGACTKEKDLPVPTPSPETKIIHYTLTIDGMETRSTLGEDFKHVFEAGDRIYVESAGDDAGKMYGFLSMPHNDGVGKSSAGFEGDLTCDAQFSPVATTPITLTLVGAADDLHTFTDGKVTGVDYTDKSASSLVDAVRKYAHFTGSGTFGDFTYTLQQHSTFLVCVLSFDEANTPAGTSVTARIYNNASTEPMYSHTADTVDIDGDIEVSWVIPFASGMSFSNARMTVSQEGKDDVNLSIADHSLNGNSFYTFQRTAYLLNYFTIEATQKDTRVKFNYATATDGVQYSRDGYDWTNYKTTDGTITLSAAGDILYFRSKRASYQNVDKTNKPLITVTDNKPCYVYGDLMFLSCDSKFKPQTSMADFAFQGLFKKCTWLRLREDKKLKLSASTLSTACYADMFTDCTGLSSLSGLELPPQGTALAPRCFDSMFYGCTGISAIPEGFLPYTQLAFACYRKMFEGCTLLATIPSDLLPALHLEKACYLRMFWGCTALKVAPDLMATTPAPGCYFQLFRNCKQIKYVKCLMLLSEEDRVGYTNPGYNDSADPPVENLEIWNVVTSWSVFNKWLVDSNNNPLNNATGTEGRFIKHPQMSYSRVKGSTNWMGVVPNNWQMEDYTDPIDW